MRPRSNASIAPASAATSMPPMIMKNLFETGLRALMLAASLALAACGPGSGGTGTGPTVTFSTKSVTAPSGGSAGPAIFAGLTVDADSVLLATGCGNFEFVGTWGVDEQNRATVVGQWQPPGAAPSQLATLQLAFTGDPL